MRLTFLIGMASVATAIFPSSAAATCDCAAVHSFGIGASCETFPDQLHKLPR